MPIIDDNGDVHLAADSRGDGIGSIVLSTGGVERARITPAGVSGLSGDGTATKLQQIQFSKTNANSSAVIDYKENTFGSPTVYDMTLFVGVNQDANGNRIVLGQPGLSWAIEGDYDDGSGTHKMEAYLQWVKADNSAPRIRPVFIQLARDTGAVTGFSLNGPDIRLNDSSDATTKIQTQPSSINLFPNTGTAQPTGNKTLQINSDGTNGTLVRLAFGATANSLELSTSSTQISQLKVNNQAVLNLYQTSGAGVAVSIGGVNQNTQMLLVDSKNRGDATAPTTILRAASGQTAEILRVESQTPTLLSGFNKGGYWFTALNAAPADADVAAGQMFLWFDSTNGAAKLMVKAKQADGTVRTGSLALA